MSILLLLFLTNCGGNQESTQHSQSNTVPQTTTNTATAANQFLYISDQNNTQVAEIAIASDGNVVITTTNGKFFGEPKGEKLKFYNNSEQMVAEIKYSESGFKVRDANSALKWKVKAYDEKIKIANNESMDNPLEIKLKNAQKITVAENGSEETIRIDPNDANVLIGKYYARGFQNNYHHAILADNRFTMLDKCMILMEINKR